MSESPHKSRRAILKSGFIAAASVTIPAHAAGAVSPGNSSAGKSESTGDEAVVRKIADNILDHAQFEFTGVDNNRVYKSTEDIPENTKVGISNGFGEWHYANGVLNLAMIDLGAALNEKKYSRFAARHIAFAFDNYRYFEKRFVSGQSRYSSPFGQLFIMRELDDCGAMGASVIEINKSVKRSDYRDYIDKAAFHISGKQERLRDGTLARKRPHPLTLWADDLYMSVPFLARMGKLTGDTKYYEDALRQVFQFTDYLWNDRTELYYHCYFDDLKRTGVAHWGRCNGWVMMAQVHLLNFLPHDHPRRESLSANLDRQIQGIARYQSHEGLWHQILDRTDSYLESSCSAMFVYSIARAVNEGWIDRRYASIALTGWEGLKALKITGDGQLKDVCIGTGIQNNMVFYYSRPAGLNEMHGLGPVIEAGVEIIRMKRLADS